MKAANTKEHRPPASSTQLSMSEGRLLVVDSNPERALVSVVSASGSRELSFEIRIGPDGPLVSVKGASIEIEAARKVGIRCDEFVVEARDKLELRSAGTLIGRSEQATLIDAKSVAIDARMGGVRVNATDDVQMLGEMVLLNCERTPPVPTWATAGSPKVLEAATASLPAESVSGDPSLLSEIDKDS